jgi:UDP-3-O-[3-hydroxymyristoyl] glucosamine N-acyltransferase
MVEPGFFATPEPVTVGELAALTGARIADGSDPGRLVTGIAPLDAARTDDVCFFENKRFSDALAATRAGACFCTEAHASLVPAGTAALVTPAPHRAFALAAARLYPAAARPEPVTGGEGISDRAYVDPAARIEAGARVEAGAVVGAGAEIGRGTLIGAGAVIGPGTRIGRDSSVGAGATVTHALIGNRVALHPGVRIGQDGFGYIPGAGGHLKVPQIGRVIIQDDVEIGANSTIDRGSIRDTIIGEGTKIDNLVQIAHNVVIGRHCLIAGQVGISGSVTIGDLVMIGGGTGIRDNLSIGHGARIAAAAAVHSNIPAGETWGGYPALRVDKWRRQMRAFNRLAGGGPKNRDGLDGE